MNLKVFDFVQGIKPKLNKFDLSHENKLTLNMGNLVPILCQEILPGDNWRVNSQIFLRMLALIAPVMHRVDVWTHYFFVPNRLIWNEWEDFITGGEDGLAAPIPPYFDMAKGDAGGIHGPSSLADYLGFGNAALTTSVNNFPVEVSALPFRAYQLIYDTFYRDQNYIDSVLFDGWKDSGNTYNNDQQNSFMTLRKRAWEHDYFTSALPDTQRGADVTVPIGGVGSMKLSNIIVNDAGGSPITTDTVLGTDAAAVPDGTLGTIDGGTWSKTSLDADVSDAEFSGVTVNSLRQSVSLQGFLEAMMRFGSRYVEYLRGIFGTNPRDSRLQRPEYLGGGLQQIAISEVLQTGQPTSTSDLPQGNMAGHGLSFGRTNGFSRAFDEHGWIIGIMSVMPRTQYNSVLPRQMFRTTRLDYYQPHLAHLGERAVLAGELALLQNTNAPRTWKPFSTPAPDDTNLNQKVIGYQSQYAEYKYITGQVHGQFTQSLAFWTMSRLFDGTFEVAIDKEFIECNPTTDIFAVSTDTDHLVCQVFHEISALRPLPLFSTPSLMFPAHA